MLCTVKHHIKIQSLYIYIHVGKEKNLWANSPTQNQHSTENRWKNQYRDCILSILDRHVPTSIEIPIYVRKCYRLLVWFFAKTKYNFESILKDRVKFKVFLCQ